MSFFKMNEGLPSEKVREKATPQTIELQQISLKIKDRSEALDKVQTKVTEIKKAIDELRRGCSQRIDEGKAIVGQTAKIAGLEAEAQEFRKRAGAIGSEISRLRKDEEAAQKNLYKALRAACFDLLPQVEANAKQKIDEALAGLSEWEQGIHDLFSQHGLVLESNDGKRLITGLWDLGSTIEKLQAYYRPDLDGFGYTAWKQQGRS